MRETHRNNRRGSALVVVTVIMTTVAMLSLSLVISVTSSSSERKGSQRAISVTYVAEAGIAEALLSLSSGGDGNIGNADAPVDYGNASFWVATIDQGSGQFAITSTGTENGISSCVEVIVKQEATSIYRWGAFGDEGVSLDSNARTDSYNSSLGAYGDQDVNGSGSNKYALANGDVGSNGDITGDSNVKVWGDATPGPTSTASFTGKNQPSGSTTPSTELVDVEVLVVPSDTGGDLTTSGNTSLGAGTHAFGSLTVGGTLYLTGPATLVIDDLEVNSNSKIVADTTAGGIEIYVRDDFILNSNASISTVNQDPADMSLYLESDNIIDPDEDVDLSTVEFDSNAFIYGTIYAPDALIDIDSNFELFGAVVARWVHLDSNSFVHFDENLMSAGAGDGSAFQTLCWREIATP